MNAYSPIIKQQRIFLTFIPLKKLEGWRKFKVKEISTSIKNPAEKISGKCILVFKYLFLNDR